MKDKIINIPITKEDLEALSTDFTRTVRCPCCNKLWLSPYPKTRLTCPTCYKERTGYGYID